MTDNTLKAQAYNLLRQFTGQSNTLTIPRPFITMTGSIEAALLLSQIIYWSDRTVMKDGWFAKSYSEWENELTLTQYQVSNAIKKTLNEFGVETKLKKFNDIPTLHYRINTPVFLNRVMKFFDNPGDMKKLDNALTEPIKPTKTVSPSGDGDRSKPKETKPREPNPMYDAIKDIWGYTATMNGAMAKMLTGIATAKGWKEYNLETPIPPDGLRQWAKWYRQTALKGDENLNMLEERIKIQSSITQWQETHQFVGAEGEVLTASYTIGSDDDPFKDEIID